MHCNRAIVDWIAEKFFKLEQKPENVKSESNMRFNENLYICLWLIHHEKKEKWWKSIPTLWQMINGKKETGARAMTKVIVSKVRELIKYHINEILSACWKINDCQRLEYKGIKHKGFKYYLSILPEGPHNKL